MPHPDELPEGTDHIINGAMATGDEGGTRDGGGFVGSAGGDDTGGTWQATTQSGGGTSMATSATSAGGYPGAGTGGTGAGDTGTGGTGGGGSDGAGGDGAGGGIREQLTGQVSALRDQAGGRVREFADGGKARASDALEELSRIVADTAESIDERMGGQYGEYARKASDAVSGFADTLRRTDVDELYTNARDAVRKSPAIAIGIAAVVGFTLARLAKSGLEATQSGGVNGGGASAGGASAGGASAGAGVSGGGTGA